MKRYLYNYIDKDLQKKMVFVSGPRQCGKTFLAKAILHDRHQQPDQRYLNWDDPSDKKALLAMTLPTGPGLVVLDEIHKYARWRNLLKGVFDKRAPELQILVTGSARLDWYRRGGDSLQGRYYHYRMHPLSFKEVQASTSTPLEDLLQYSGFPEPFLSKSLVETARWGALYQSRVIQEDLLSLEKVSELSLVEQLAYRLPELVGSPLSVNNLREDLAVAHQTVARWLDILERLFMLFRIYPFGSPKIKAVKKESKHYHYNWTLVDNPGHRFENMIACHLLKWCQFREDTLGERWELRYFRDTEQREVDFVLMEKRIPKYFIECKLGDTKPSPHLLYLKKKFPQVPAWQIVNQPGLDVMTPQDIRIVDARVVLATLI